MMVTTMDEFSAGKLGSAMLVYLASGIGLRDAVVLYEDTGLVNSIGLLPKQG
jgi:hypothetical protein